MEYLTLGSLHDYIHEPSNPIDAKIAVKLGFDIVKGMAHLHDNNIIHCDLAARNLLLQQEGELLRAKVTDFGLDICNSS